LCSEDAEANERHSTYSLRYARISYPWHPLFNRTVQVSHFRRGKDLKCIYTTECPGLGRELPNWMFDEAYCSKMVLGSPEICIKGLEELAEFLGLCRQNQTQHAQSHPSRKKDGRRAKTQNSHARSAHAQIGAPEREASTEARSARAGRSLGEPSTGSRRRGKPDCEGGRG